MSHFSSRSYTQCGWLRGGFPCLCSCLGLYQFNFFCLIIVSDVCKSVVSENIYSVTETLISLWHLKYRTQCFPNSKWPLNILIYKMTKIIVTKYSHSMAF